MYKVLVADDESIVRTAMSSLVDWQQINCQVLNFAKNGIEAWNFLQHNAVDIAVLDIRMPGLTGIQIAEMIKQENLNTSVIFLTAYSDFELVREALRVEAIDYVTKSDFEVELPQAIKKCIEKRKRKATPIILDLNIPKPCESYSDPVNQVIAYIYNNYSAHFNLSDISNAVHLNDSYLCRLYKKQTNFTIVEDITRYRLHQAKIRLKEGKSIKDTAYECGFDNSSYFTNVFTKLEGITPKEYKLDNMESHDIVEKYSYL